MNEHLIQVMNRSAMLFVQKRRKIKSKEGTLAPESLKKDPGKQLFYFLQRGIPPLKGRKRQPEIGAGELLLSVECVVYEQ